MLIIRTNRTFFSSLENSCKWTYMNFHCLEFAACFTSPPWLWFFQCHTINYACAGMLNIRSIWGISGKWRNTFRATMDFPTCLYFSSPHLIHWSLFTCSPQNNIHPFTQTSMTSYVSPSFFNVVEVSYSKKGSVLGIGRMFFLEVLVIQWIKALDIPWIKALDIPWMRQPILEELHIMMTMWGLHKVTC